ncbi:MAG: hypothetical protein F4103_12335 [Boseongicola sp. SB0673_bin_14]|nr:hypothetical protein [Boseongicola sp. SB0673_bin_14]
MKRPASPALALAAAAAVLSACGGESRLSLDRDAAVSLTGSAQPAETFADQAARSAAIGARTDGVAHSSIYGVHDGEEDSFATECIGTQCRFFVPGTENALPLAVPFLDGAQPVDPTEGVSAEAFLAKNGITLIHVQSGLQEPESRTRFYGAWMDHGAFMLAETSVTETGDDGTPAGAFEQRLAWAWGALTGSAPPSSATWRGVMVGTPQQGSRRGHVLQGDATLVYNLESRTVDAGFTGIVDLDREAAHTVAAVRFDGIDVASNGTFEFGTFGNLLRGGFGGPGHEEAAGAFEKQGIVGAFGAKRQTAN